jgi:hypothetical protein
MRLHHGSWCVSRLVVLVGAGTRSRLGQLPLPKHHSDPCIPRSELTVILCWDLSHNGTDFALCNSGHRGIVSWQVNASIGCQSRARHWEQSSRPMLRASRPRKLCSISVWHFPLPRRAQRQYLTIAALDPVAKIPEYKVCAVRLRAVNAAEMSGASIPEEPRS